MIIPTDPHHPGSACSSAFLIRAPSNVTPDRTGHAGENHRQHTRHPIRAVIRRA